MTAARKKRPQPAAATGSSADLTRLLDLITVFPKQTIALVGDLVLDQFVSGEISRVSREAPVLILRHRRTRALPGGGANALNNLADLGARVLPVGAVGDDRSGLALLEYFRRKRIDVSGIEKVRGWTTPTKTQMCIRDRCSTVFPPHRHRPRRSLRFGEVLAARTIRRSCRPLDCPF